MCGIAGSARTDQAPIDRDLIDAMCRAQEHRGPDSRGVHISPGVGLGIQRLRVIDLATGDQPIYNEDRSVVVVLNGEIYNYRELREQLRRSGHSFASDGDTEVIVHLYEERGADCVQQLQGMFAFALWDARHRQLLLARDRVGKKPLFYAQREGVLSFASELPALLEDPEVPRQIDDHAIDAYLAHGYIPAPLCAYSAVKKLMPASTLLYRDGRATVDRYWRLDYRKRSTGNRAEVEEEIREGIRRAVKRRMIADVPLGAFLSGGIDSSAVVAAMAEASSEPVKTFSIGFEDERYNELPLARRVAQEFSTDHHELVLRPDAIEMLPQLVRHYGEPFADHSALPCFYLARFARRHVTVALNGDGGDENFAGYQRYTTNLALAGFDRWPAAVRTAAATTAGWLPSNGHSRGWLNRTRRFALAAELGRESRYLTQHCMFTPEQRAGLYTPEYAARLGASQADKAMLDAWRTTSATELLDQLLDVDVNSYLPGDLLTKIDIATMAFSLEARSPLLDHEFMQLTASLPAALKAGRGHGKRILRTALRDWLPDEILDAPKRGFEVPVARWFRTDLRDYAYDTLLDPAARSRQWCSEGAVRSLLNQHVAGVQDHGRQIWTLLMLELWSQTPASDPSDAIQCSLQGS